MYKVVLIHPNAGMDWDGDTENLAIALARRLDNYFAVELLSGAECGRFSRPIAAISRSQVIKSEYYPLIKKVLRGWFDRPEIAIESITSFLPCLAYLLQHQADLIFPFNGYGGLLAAYCIRAIKGTPILFSQHNSLSKKHLQRNLNLQPDRLIVPNPAVARDIQHLASQPSLDIIPYGVDLAEFTPTGKAIITGLPKPTILCVAPLERNDRLETAIAAVARLPQASLLICGHGGDRDYFQELGDRTLGKDRFQIKDFAYAQMPQVYRSADVFTLPSVKTVYGLPYIEAMACGLPVVAPDDAVRRYLIEDAGITCDVTDPDVYSQSLQIALDKCWNKRKPRYNALRFGWQDITLLYRRAILKTIIQPGHDFVVPTT